MSCKYSLEDYRWLVSDAARPYCEQAAATDKSLVGLTKSLRRELSTSRTHLVIELAELRERARAKFTAASQMFFTRQLLEQATDEWIARHKAQRFPREQAAADLCCGIGGDLLALAATGPVTGIDRDPVATLLTAANGIAHGMDGLLLETADAALVDLRRFAAWHIDPDRRVGGRRSSTPEACQPSVEQIEQLLAVNPNGAVKLAPAAQVPAPWTAIAELEWIESRGECRQLVAWFGALSNQPGQRRATIVSGKTAVTFCSRGQPVPQMANDMPPFVFEPAPCVFAANLDGNLACENNWCRLSDRAGYLGGERALESPLAECFEVLDVLPLDIRRIKAYLRERRIGRLEIKKRGLPLSPERLSKQLKVSGQESATLILCPFQNRTVALVVSRTNPPP